jgi:RNA recognition motif-containing protein
LVSQNETSDVRKEERRKIKKSKSKDAAPIAETPEEETDKKASKKRKREALPDEIEVDVNLPEPLSKKEARRAKKAKSNPNPSKEEDPNAASASEAKPTQEDSEKKAGQRSDFGAWIGNLPWSATKDTLRSFLTENSDISSDHITRIHMPPPSKPVNPNWTRKPMNKGFAYVDFSNQLAMYSAIALTETMMDGRPLLIKNAKSFDGRPEKPKEENTDGKVGNGKNPPNKRIFVGNLAFDVSKEDLLQHFGQCGEVAMAHMATFEDTGKCKGYAWVTFEDVEAATSAVKGFIYKEEAKADDAGSADEEGKPQKKSKRKWMVNRLRGRDLRCEFAEDSTVRYKKRYGKDKPVEMDGVHPDRMKKIQDDGPSERPYPQKEFRERKPRGKVDPRTIKSGAAHTNAPRAPQGIVKAEGKKITFD